jgi:Ca-activated chloride channel family protein
MNWENTWNHPLLVFVCLIVLAYLVYLVRLWYLARNFKIEYVNILKKILIRATYIALIIIAILGPSFVGDDTSNDLEAGKDIWIALDVSYSMKISDVLPSRLDVAKQNALQLLQLLKPNDRVGLLLFADKSHIASPLTFDHQIVANILESIQSQDLESAQSNQNQLFETLRNIQKNNTTNHNESNLVLLISDADFSEPTNEAILNDIKQKYKIWTLITAHVNGANLPWSYKKQITTNQKSNNIKSKPNQKAVENISHATRGDYILYANLSNITNEWLAAFNSLHASKQTMKRKTSNSANKYKYVLWLALVLILLDGLSTSKIITI